MKSVTKWMACMLVLTIMVTGFPTRVYAKSLGEADLSESSRGYCGLGNQDKDREEDSITVRVSIGGGDSDWETGDFSDYYVYKSGEIVFDQYELSFGDIDDDGDIDMTDLFNRLEDYKAANTCDLSYSTSDYGDFYQDVFGISTGGSLTYKLNNIFCQAGTPDLYDGDSIVILLMTGDSNQWSEIDDSIYEHVTPSSNPNSVSTSWYDGDNGGTNDESGREGYYKYIDLMCENLEESFTDNVSLSDGNCFWQEMRILRNNNITDPFYIDKLDYFEKYHEAKVAEAEAGKLKAVNAMRDASVTGNEQMLNYLAHGYNGTDAATFDIKAGQYAVDYILMCLDNEDYASNEEMAVKLTDAAESQSVRDDLIRYIVETDGCWGGSWFTYDTVDGKTYDLYEAADMSSETTTVFLAYLPNTITEEQLMNIDNYEVVKGNEKKTIMIGDVDANSQVDVKDALHVIRLWVGKETIDSNRMLMSANVDGDSDITNSDTLAIVEYKVNSKQFKVLY